MPAAETPNPPAKVDALMQIVEFGWLRDGSTDWTECVRYPTTTANRARILARDREHPTGSDGWKIVPQNLTHPDYGRYVTRIRWEDLRAYALAERVKRAYALK